MFALNKFRIAVITHTLSRGERIRKFRIFLLETDELLHQPVIFKIGYNRCIQHIIPVVMTVEFLP